MIVSVFIRRLKEGVSFEEFEAAWEADDGYGVPARVFNSISLESPRDILTIGFVGIDAEQLQASRAATAEHDRGRHERIDALIESTELRAMYELRSEHDFSAAPRTIELSSAESLLATLQTSEPTAKGGIEDE